MGPYTNRALESAGRPNALTTAVATSGRALIKFPSVHLGPAASQMEKRGIRTDKGEVNRQIAADNKLLKEIKARITRLYNWSKAEAEKPEGQQPSMIDLWEAQQQLKRPDTRTGKIRALQESAALFSFLQANGIQSMQQLHEKIADMNSRYYDLRGKIVKAERRIATLTERGEMWEQYNQYKSIHKQLAKVKPEKREQFEQRHSRELILWRRSSPVSERTERQRRANHPKAWQRKSDQLAAGKQTDTLAMKSMRKDLKAVERLRKTAEQLSRQERTSLTTGSRSGKGYRRVPLTTRHTFCTQKNRRTGFPIRRQTVYLPNKSLCVPVRPASAPEHHPYAVDKQLGEYGIPDGLAQSPDRSWSRFFSGRGLPIDKQRYDLIQQADLHVTLDGSFVVLF